MTDHVLTRRVGAVRWLIFNKPEKHNALSLDMNEAALKIIEAFAAAADERVLVVAGAGGKAFVSGADISEFEDRRSNAEKADDYARITQRMFFALRDLEKPTVAMIQGYCLGGGVALATCCDIRIGAQQSVYGVPAARLGIGYSADFIKLLADLVGPSRAKEFLYTSRRYSSGEAYEMGLLNRVIETADLEGYVAKYAADMADNAPLTQRATKIVVSELLAGTDGNRGRQAVADCANSEDFRDARRAFMEKRKPVFNGR